MAIDRNMVSKISKDAGCTIKIANAVIDALLEEIKQGLIEGRRVNLAGFGAFETRKRKSRVARNPKTNEEVVLDEITVPVFKPSNKLKEIIGRN